MDGKLSSSSFLVNFFCCRSPESSSIQEKSLMDLIASMDEDGHCDIPIQGSFEENPVRVFSAAELNKATESFNHALLLTQDAFWKIYRGSFKKHNLNLALIKKYESDKSLIPQIKSFAVRDIAIAAQMCNHDNVLKLVGVCLEFETPVLIYEHPERVRLLSDVLFRNGSLAWKTRLGLAYNIASAILHMHTAFTSKIVHRNLKLENIFLDKDETAKLFDFSFTICIPPGRRPNYAAEETLDSMKECIANHELNLIVDIKILEEEEGGGQLVEQERRQLMAFADLSLICMNERREMRPSMGEVFDELRRLQELTLPSSLA